MTILGDIRSPAQPRVLASGGEHGGLPALMPNILLFLTVAHIMSYDYLPKVTSVISALLPVAVLATVLFAYARNLGEDQLEALLFIAGLGVCAVILRFGGYAISWAVLERYILALTGLCIALFVRGETLRRSAPIYGAVVIVFAGAVGLAQGPVMYAGSGRLDPFTGGDMAVHSSALAVTAAVIAILASKPLKSLWGLIAGIGVLEVIGYGTTGEFISCIVAVVGFSYYQGVITTRVPVKRIAILASPLIAYVVFAKESLFAATGASDGAATMGSGRVGAWQERFEIALHRGWEFNLIGTGPGSDVRFTDVWWWEAKGAHSDLLTLFMEFGILGLAATVLLIVLLARRVGPRGRIALAAALVGALISNALLDRPVQALFFGLAIASTARHRPARHDPPGALDPGSDRQRGLVAGGQRRQAPPGGRRPSETLGAAAGEARSPCEQ
jgi:hypothetical protein